LIPAVAGAQEQGTEAGHDAEHFFRHEVSFILAGTYETREEAGHHGEERAGGHGGQNNFLTLGSTYEFRFHRLFGVGGTAEYITHEKNWLFVFPAYFHVYRGLKLFAGPGFEIRHEEAKTEAVLRLGAAYAFEFAEHFSIAPAIAVDLVGREQAVVYGLDIGVAF